MAISVEELFLLLKSKQYDQALAAAEEIISAKAAGWHKAAVIKMEALFRTLRYAEMNNFAKAIEAEFFKEASAGEKCDFLVWRGRFFHQHCKFLTAEETYQKAGAIAENACLPVKEARILTATGAVYNEYKNPEAFKQAYECFQKAIDLLSILERKPEALEVLARTYGEIARWYMEKKNPEHSFERALGYSFKDLEASEEAGYKLGVEHMRNQIAQCYNALNRPQNAIKILEQNLNDSGVDTKSKFYGKVELAYSYLLLGDGSRAVEIANEAVAEFKEAGQPDYEPYLKLARIYMENSLYDDAEKQAKKCIQTTEKARPQVGKTPIEKRAYMENQHAYYEFYRGLMLKKEEIRRAAAFHEMAAARTFIDLYFALQGTDGPLFNDTELWAELTQAEQELKKYERYSAEWNGCERVIRRRLNELTAQFEDALYEKSDPVRMNELELIKAFNVICNHRPRAVLVILCTTADGPGAFLISREKDSYIAFGVSGFAYSFDKSDFEFLGEKIIKPILVKFPSAEQLIILPENVLQIPYLHAAVIDGKYVAERMRITYNVSAYLLSENVKASNCGSGSLAVFSRSDGSDKDEPVFYTEAQTVAVKCRMKEHAVKAGAAMTRDAVLSALRDYHSVHIAAHVKYSGDEPFCARLHCGNGDFITPLHILGSGRASAHFVSLASCESGKSFDRGMREPYSMVSALLAAGVKNVLAASEIVSGPHSFEFMESFYVYYKGNPAEAYFKAQQEMIKKDSASHDWVKYFLFSSL